jgi:MFS family permease
LRAVPQALAPLRIPGFARLAASYALNELGDWMGIIALSVLVWDRTGDPLATTGLFVAGKFVPSLLAPLLTARIDQVAAGRSLTRLYVAEALAFLALAASADAFWLPAVLALALADGTLALTGRAISRSAAVAILEPAGRLREGNAILNVGFSISAALGPAMAGLLVAWAGVGVTLLVDAGSFLLVAVILAGARGLPGGHEEREPWGPRVREGLCYVRSHRRLLLLILAEGAAFIFFAMVLPIEVVYAKDTLGTGDAGYGAMLASWGAGMVVGSAVFARTRGRSLIPLIALSSALVGAAYVGIAAVDTLLLACLISAVGGLGNGVQWVAVVTAVQEATAQAFQARVMSLLESLAAAMPGVGYVLGGALASIASPRVSYLVAGLGVFAVLLVMGALALRAPPSGPADPDADDGQAVAAAGGPSDDSASRSSSTVA